jgi:uncharacterized membrane protein SpoIIM required for sporulation
MTPLEFEAAHAAAWTELESLLARPERELEPERFLALYRSSCEQFALAQARGVPEHVVERLARLTANAHQIIYRRTDFGFARLAEALLNVFPAMVRRHRRYVAAAAVLFIGPALALGAAVYREPELIYSLVSAAGVAQFEQMYGPGAEAIGRVRNAGTDWQMFGFYIQNNISIAFQCYVMGIVCGVGSVFFLCLNGLLIGAVAGFVAERGYGGAFFPFVATHSAFELSAIVLSGAAGLRLGAAVLSPGRPPRVAALQVAARDTSFIVFGAAVMLVIAAALEAFWSSAAWVPPPAKYACAAFCWVLVLMFFVRRPHAD